MDSPRICLCMIVRDEETMLPGCLASVASVVDAIVVVDTGSSDETVNIAAAHGAKVVHRAWDDDFSAARNFALEHASGDWVLTLDADERLTEEAGAVLRGAVARDDFDCGMLPLHNAQTLDAPLAAVVSGEQRLAEVAYLPRVMRRTDDLRYTGIVHENVGEWAKGRRVAMLEGVDVVHLGGVPSLRERRDKSARNIRLLERYIAGAPEDVTPYGYLAHEHHEAGDADAGRDVAAAGWALVTAGVAASELAVLRLATAHAWLSLTDRRPEEAANVCERALASMPRHPDLYFLRGCAHEAAALSAPNAQTRRTRLVLARDDYQRAVERDGELVLQKFVDGGSSWAALTRRATTELLLGQPREALTSFDASLTLRPAREASWGKAEALIGVDSPKEALVMLKDHLDDRPDGWTVAAVAAEAMGMLEQMMTTLARAQSVVEAGFVSPHRRERYVDMLALGSIYSGRPAALPGPIGQVAAWMAGETPTEVRGRPLDGAALGRALAHARAHGRDEQLRPLASEQAQRQFPELAKLLEASA